jgi:hypothetical protein
MCIYFVHVRFNSPAQLFFKPYTYIRQQNKYGVEDQVILPGEQ